MLLRLFEFPPWVFPTTFPFLCPSHWASFVIWGLPNNSPAIRYIPQPQDINDRKEKGDSCLFFPDWGTDGPQGLIFGFFFSLLLISQSEILSNLHTIVSLITFKLPFLAFIPVSQLLNFLKVCFINLYPPTLWLTCSEVWDSASCLTHIPVCKMGMRVIAVWCGFFFFLRFLTVNLSLWLSLFWSYRWENWGSESWTDLSQVTQLILAR